MAISRGAEKSEGDPNLRTIIDANLSPAAAAAARVTPATEVATGLANSPEALCLQEIEHINKVVEKALGDIESIVDEKVTAAPSSAIATFKLDMLTKILQLPVFKYKTKWLEEVDKYYKAGNTKDLIDLRSKYWVDKGSTGLMNEAIDMAKIYLERMTTVNGRITGDLLLKMLESTSQQAAIYVDLLRSRKNRDLVEAAKGAMVADSNGVALAMDTVSRRLDNEYPKGKAMEILWMIMGFLPPAARVIIAQNYLKGNPGFKTAFVDEGNKMGVFGPEDIQNITGKTLSPEERATLAENWQKQNDFIESAKFMAEDTYGSNNAAQGINVINTLKVIGTAAAWVTIGGNFAVTTFAYTRNKKFLEAIGMLPAAVRDTLKDHNVKIAGAALIGMHYWEKAKNEPAQPKSGPDYNLRQGHEALYTAKNSLAFWPEWDSFFTSDNFAGGKAFANYIDEVIKFSFSDDKASTKLTAGHFLDFLNREAKSQSTDSEGIDYAKLAQWAQEKLSGTSDANMELLATAFIKLGMGGKDIKDTYPKAIKDSDEFMLTASVTEKKPSEVPPKTPPAKDQPT